MSLKDTCVCPLKLPKSGSKVRKHCFGLRLFSLSRHWNFYLSPGGWWAGEHVAGEDLETGEEAETHDGVCPGAEPLWLRLGYSVSTE